MKYSRVNANQRCCGQIKVLSLSVDISRIFLLKKESNYITLKMKKNQVLLKDGIKQLKTKCRKCLLQTTILFTGIR